MLSGREGAGRNLCLAQMVLEGAGLAEKRPSGKFNAAAS